MRKKIILISIIVIAMFSMSIFFIFYFKKDHWDINGEIMIMQGKDELLTPLILYKPETDKRKETIEVFTYPKYNVNNPDHIIAVISKDGEDAIYEISSYNNISSNDKRFDNQERLIYTGNNIMYPQFVPDREAISFIENEKLYFYDIVTGERQFITNMDLVSYDWLNSDTVLYSTSDKTNRRHIMAYDIKSNTETLYKESASSPTLSINKKFFAYRSSMDRNIVYVQETNTKNKKTITLDVNSIDPLNVSPDGKFILAHITDSGDNYQNDSVIINVSSLQLRTVIEGSFSFSTDWK